MIPSKVNANASESPLAPLPPFESSDSSRFQSTRFPPLTVQPDATILPKRTSMPTPPPSAHPRSLSSPSFSQNHPRVGTTTSTTVTHTPPLLPNGPDYAPAVAAHGVNSIYPPTRLQNPPHVSSSNYPQQQQQQQQQRQVLIQENGVVHAQFAPHSWAPPQPQVVTELAAATSKLRPATFPLDQQQHQLQQIQQQHQQQQQQRTMTHSAATTTATAVRPAHASAPVRPNQSQLYPIPAHATRGQQPVQSAVTSTVPGAPGTQARPQPVMQPHTQTSERIQKLPPPVSVPSPSPPTQSQAQPRPQQQQQQLQQQQEQQDASMHPPTVAAFRVLQPAKALLEKTWATAMDAVGREFAELNAEHIRSVREQRRLTEMLQRCESERVQALRSLHDTKARLRECKCFSLFLCNFC